jgi:hypothetical protein
VGYWRFNESLDDQRVLNSSSNTNHGTLGSTLAIEANDPTRVVSTAPIRP